MFIEASWQSSDLFPSPQQLIFSIMDSIPYFIFAVVWIVISAFLYGYHISALNSAQDAISCHSASLSNELNPSSFAWTAPCIAMSETLFGLLTASYTIGGFLGSLYASRLADNYGRKHALLTASALIGSGSIIMSISNAFFFILFGRTIIGIGCGLNTVLVPIYLSEISPPSIRGSIGVMNQLAIVIGIFISQLISLPFAKSYDWRWIFAISAAVSLFHLFTSPLMIESPKWVLEQKEKYTKKSDATDSNQQSQQNDDFEDNSTLLTIEDMDHSAIERQLLLNSTAHDGSNQSLALNVGFKDPISISQLLMDWRSDPALANGLKIVLLTQIAQQLSGINAVLYYSTSIMKSVLPTQAIYISLFICAINLLMTFPPIFLVDRLGRKSLLLFSLASMALTSFTLAISINYAFAKVSSIAIVLFVASFSVGLGPVPFVIFSEIVPAYAVSAAGSLGLSVNWASNFLVGMIFLPMRNALSSPDGDGDGNVFFVFTFVTFLFAILIHQNYK
ncbi:hypothetical protein O181_038380 [Austropuccinia psidii MF-1]|uniref:Major facilitator superfamily (MFS) profile domain-containing protein n=1 Tax=Austropuccinia psidii MF-1 TaxID=1389203 RepID=A0A9Q3DCS8_9BASI|nr:hypothetical protein [Austropuccinia psidii MF-1]